MIRPRSRTVGCAIAILVLVAAGQVATTPAAADDAEACVTEVAWDSKIKKKLRARERDKARERAVRRLSKQAWSAGQYTDVTLEYSSIRSGEGGGASEDRAMWRTSHETYSVDARLARGSETWIGDKRRMELRYCVPMSTFDTVRDDLEREYTDTLDDIRRQFESLERAVQAGDHSRADRTLDDLFWRVYEARAGRAMYRSGVSGEERTFDSWLDEYRRRVRDADAIARSYLEKARELISDGHLVQARQALGEVYAYDRSGVRGFAGELESDIDERYEERRRALAQAESYARAGKFAAADRKIREAREIDRDDEASLDEARERVADLRAQYLVYNPRSAGGFLVGLGALGVDPSATSDRVVAATGLDLRGDEPLHLGFEGMFRLGRYWQFSIAGTFGQSSLPDEGSYGGEPFFRSYQVITGLGFRTIRSESRSFGIRVIAGPAYESVDLDFDVDGFASSSSATGIAARFAVEFGMVSLFAQQGIGFADDGSEPTALIAWDDRSEFGITLLF